ncbi:hypothetical protein D3C80_2129570 [compost metagenome]
MHHHHAFNGIDELMLLVGVGRDEAVLRVVGGTAAHRPGAVVDFLQEYSQRLHRHALFARVVALIA